MAYLLFRGGVQPSPKEIVRPTTDQANRKEAIVTVFIYPPKADLVQLLFGLNRFAVRK
jgi:hypothetical protein